LWPESLKAAGGIKNNKVLKFFEWFSKFQYKHSRCHICKFERFQKEYCNEGDFGQKIEFLPNWAEDEMLSSELLKIPDLPHGFNIVFTGNIGEAQDFDSIVEAAKYISPEENIHFLIIGDGSKKNLARRTD